MNEIPGKEDWTAYAAPDGWSVRGSSARSSAEDVASGLARSQAFDLAHYLAGYGYTTSEASLLLRGSL